MILGALETGGTKMVCSIGDEQGHLHDRLSIPTTMPEETLNRIVDYFADKNIEALGIAGFGPLDLNEQSPTYGYITTTPKEGWANCALLPYLRERLHVPVGIDTDVGAAVLAEWKMGAGAGKQGVVYLTVGTGIGGGIVAGGRLIHGMVHPEAGHITLKPHPKDPHPEGFCPFHVSCLEGLAKGPTFDARWGVSAKDLPEDHIGWEIEAYYLAQFCADMLTLLSSEVIVLGGGVMHKTFLYDMIRAQTLKILNGYIACDEVVNHIDRIIVAPGLGDNSGVTGALILAAQAAQKK